MLLFAAIHQQLDGDVLVACKFVAVLVAAAT
jgi:hypothetical protein